jgi:hypothetical protein
VTSTLSEVEPSPVFVDESGRRGRRLRGLGWIVGVAFVGATLAMISGLLGTQSDAPSFTVPGTADTLPPGQYVNAPLPAPPGKANRSKSAPRTDTPSGTPSGTPTATTSPTASATETSGEGRATATGAPATAERHTKPPAVPSTSAKPTPTLSAPAHESPTPSPSTQPGTPSAPAP